MTTTLHVNHTLEAKKLVREVLKRHGFDNRLTATRVSFLDLARAGAVIVLVHDWKPNPIAEVIREQCPGVIVTFGGVS